MLVVEVILRPLNKPLLFASRIALLNPSTTNRKSRGDSGNPCLRPILAWKKGESSPFIRTKKEVVVMPAKIYFMNG